MSKQYIDPEQVRKMLEDLRKVAVEKGDTAMLEQKESSIRKKFKTLKGVSEEMTIATILALFQAGYMRNNLVVTLPQVNDDGIVSCVLCNKFPVVKPIAIVPNADPEPGEDDLSFICFVCATHADNLEATQKEIDDKHIIWRLAQERKAMNEVELE